MVQAAESKITASPAAADGRWARVTARDRSADGLFWYAVATTGVFCRPSCPSRTANPRNVAFYDSPGAARAAGFRPCLRCDPEGSSPRLDQTALVAEACRRIEASEQAPPLGQLAALAGMSEGRFHRLFKAVTGVTPKAYAAARRARAVRTALDAGEPVTRALYEAGFGSSGRFYENAKDMLGMKPTIYRAGGVGETLRFAIGQSSLGAILVASSQTGVAAIFLGDEPEPLVRELQDRFPKARIQGADPDYERLVAEVVGFIEQPELGLDLPLDIRGTAFQQRVWQALRAIPSGATVSYTDVARAIGAPQAVRAVAGACAANAISLAIPCHRVVRTDGSLSGYAWGVERKRALIEREARALAKGAPVAPISATGT